VIRADPPNVSAVSAMCSAALMSVVDVPAPAVPVTTSAPPEDREAGCLEVALNRSARADVVPSRPGAEEVLRARRLGQAASSATFGNTTEPIEPPALSRRTEWPASASFESRDRTSVANSSVVACIQVTL
jgi:hypothetical protein